MKFVAGEGWATSQGPTAAAGTMVALAVGYMAMLTLGASVANRDMEMDGSFVGSTLTVAVVPGQHGDCGEEGRYADCRRTMEVSRSGERGAGECGDGEGGGGEVVSRLTKGSCASGCLRPTLRDEAAKDGATMKFAAGERVGHQPALGF